MLESMSGIVPALALGLRISVRERYRIKARGTIITMQQQQLT
jgi:hypothetical protein